MRYWHLSQFAIIYVLEGKAMKKINCENCKCFGGQCQNFEPIRKNTRRSFRVNLRRSMNLV